MDVLASRFQMDFTVREHPGRISCLWKRNVPVPTRILQCLVSDKTFPNPLIYQMANPVNSLRNIITCNLFCYSFSACASLSLAASQEPGWSCSLSAAIPCAVGILVLPGVLPLSLEQQDSGEGGRHQLGAAFQALAALEVLIPLDGGNTTDQDLLLGWKKSQPDSVKLWDGLGWKGH